MTRENNRKDDVIQFIESTSKLIDGWFFPPDMICFYAIDKMQKEFNITGSLCEVGVYKGKSIILLSFLARPEEIVTGFDLFPENLLQDCIFNISKFGRIEFVNLIKRNTSECSVGNLRSDLKSSLRILHIDAGHEYHEVMHQLVTFTPFLNQGGVIIMDDYQDREFPGIEAAVLDFCEIDRPRRFVPFMTGGNKIYLCENENYFHFQKNFLMRSFLGISVDLLESEISTSLFHFQNFP